MNKKNLLYIGILLILSVFTFALDYPNQGLNPYYNSLAQWLNISHNFDGTIRPGLNISVNSLNITNNILITGDLVMFGSLNATSINATEILVNGAIVNRSISLTDYQYRADAFNYANNLSFNKTLINQYNTTWVISLKVNNATWADNTSGVNWNNINQVPLGFADGVDDTGASDPSVYNRVNFTFDLNNTNASAGLLNQSFYSNNITNYLLRDQRAGLGIGTINNSLNFTQLFTINLEYNISNDDINTSLDMTLNRNINMSASTGNSWWAGIMRVAISIFQNGFQVQTINAIWNNINDSSAWKTHNDTLKLAIATDMGNNKTAIEASQWNGVNDSSAEKTYNITANAFNSNVYINSSELGFNLTPYLKNYTDATLINLNVTTNFTMQALQCHEWKNASGFIIISECVNVTGCRITRNYVSGNNETLC